MVPTRTGVCGVLPARAAVLSVDAGGACRLQGLAGDGVDYVGRGGAADLLHCEPRGEPVAALPWPVHPRHTTNRHARLLVEALALAVAVVGRWPDALAT